MDRSCEQYDTLSECANLNKRNVNELESQIQKLSAENKTLKQSNQSLSDSVIDLKCRSMRDNLLFFGIPEGPVSNFFIHEPINSTESSPLQSSESMETERSGERTLEASSAEHGSHLPVRETTADRPVIVTDYYKIKVYRFCEDILKIKDPQNTVRIIRAHRIGKFNTEKIHPIVTKFDEEAKPLLKEYLTAVNLRPTPYTVANQWPQDEQERRKSLFPIMHDKRSKGHRAVLVRDKIFVNDVEYVPSPVIDADNCV